LRRATLRKCESTLRESNDDKSITDVVDSELSCRRSSYAAAITAAMNKPASPIGK
jgi:hypothetical protein